MDLRFPFVAYRSDRTEAIGSGFALGRGLLKLRDFLADTTRRLTKKEKEAGIQRDLCNQNINLLCHSMGNYVLQNAIQRMVEQSLSGRLPKIFDQVFLCSPDVDDNVLEAGQPLGKVHEVCRNVTVYFNEGDLALHGSDYTKGNPERLGTNGAANPNQLHQKIYQVNCSGDIVQGLLEHSYYLAGRINADLRMSLDNIPRDHSTRHPRKDDRFPNTFIMK
jgi:esterase/lipase superfamily enzyme